MTVSELFEMAWADAAALSAQQLQTQPQQIKIPGF